MVRRRASAVSNHEHVRPSFETLGFALRAPQDEACNRCGVDASYFFTSGQRESASDWNA